jgi:hypothetical protein
MAKKGFNIRNHHKERIYKKRIKRIKINWFWRFFEDSNGDRKQTPMWVDLIDHPNYIHFKTHTTKRIDSRHKIKYSPNKGFGWRDWKKSYNSYCSLEKDKLFVKKEIENGIREYKDI